VGLSITVADPTNTLPGSGRPRAGSFSDVLGVLIEVVAPMQRSSRGPAIG